MLVELCVPRNSRNINNIHTNVHTTGVDINKCDGSGLTALLWACSYGQQSTVEFLLGNGADVGACGAHGENALLLAGCGGFKEIVRLLLKLGLDVNYTDEVVGKILLQIYKDWTSIKYNGIFRSVLNSVAARNSMRRFPHLTDS